MTVGIFGDQLIQQGDPVVVSEVSPDPSELVPQELVEEEVVESESDEPQAEEEPSEEDSDEPALAKDLIEEIEAAQSVEEVDAIVGDDDRVTVVKAADKRKKELSE